MDFKTKNNPRGRRMASLKEVLAYRNDNIVCKFTANYPIAKEDAQELFEQLKKWLWVGAYIKEINDKESKKIPNLKVTSSLWILDEMWHTFILFTKDYKRFCMDYFGFFIHHTPSLNPFEIKPYNPEADIHKKYEVQHDLLCFALGKELGEETFLKWYQDYPKRYPIAQLKNSKK